MMKRVRNVKQLAEKGRSSSSISQSTGPRQAKRQPRIERKLGKLQSSLQFHQSILFCVMCGSTNVGQASLHELRCHDCGNTLEWDGLSFGLLQASSRPETLLSKAKQVFRLRDKTPPWVDAAEVEESSKS